MIVLVGDGLQHVAHEAVKQHIDCVAFCPFPSQGYPPETRVVSGMQELYLAINDFASEDEDCLIAQNHKADLGGLDSDQIANKIDQLYQRKVLSLCTMDQLYEVWAKNACHNSLARLSRPTIDSVSFDDTPAVLVLPGPSLAANVHKLQNLKGKAVIIAGQRAWKQLTEAEITPDCVVAVDGQGLVYNHMANQPLDRTSLILEQSVHPTVMNLRSRNTLVFEGQGAQFPWYDELFPETVHLAPGTTISSSMMALAAFWKCNPVITLGMDLAYSGKSRYGSTVNVGGKHDPVCLVDGQNGESIPSSPDLAATKDWIEYLISQEPGIDWINCSEGGALVQGMRHVPLSETFAMCSESIDSPMLAFDTAKPVGSYKELMNNVRQSIREGKIPEEFRDDLVRTLRR